MKKVFIVDGNNFSDLEEFYEEIKRVLTNNFKEFGRNLDAFNDILYGGFGRFESNEQIELIWENSNKSKRDLGYPETLEYLKLKLKKCNKLNRKSIQKELELCEKQRGPTLFDLIIKIINSNKNVKLTLK